MKNIFVQIYNTHDNYDKWGNCSTWAFALCDFLTDMEKETDKKLCPDYWEFRQSPLGSNSDEIEYQEIKTAIENDTTLEELLKFSDILYRYYNLLKKHGYNY